MSEIHPSRKQAKFCAIFHRAILEHNFKLVAGWFDFLDADCLKFDAFVGFELVAPDVQKFVG